MICTSELSSAQHPVLQNQLKFRRYVVHRCDAVDAASLEKSLAGLGRACRLLPSADGYHLSTAPKSRTAGHTRKQSAGTMPETCTDMWRSVSQYSSGTTLGRAGARWSRRCLPKQPGAPQ